MPDNRKRICFLLYNLDPGGLETHLLRFIKYAGKDFQSVIIVKKGVEGDLFQPFKEAGAELFLIRTGYFNVGGWMKILKVFKRTRFYAICDFTSNFSGIYLVLAWLANIQIRLAYYGQSTHHFKPGLFRNAYDRFANYLVRKFATTIVFNSNAARQFFFPNLKQGANGPAYHIIYNGIDTGNFFMQSRNGGNIKQELGIPDDSFLVIHTGRYDEKKNHVAVIKLAEVLVEKFPFLYFILCGKGTEQLNEKMCAALRGRVFALGYRTDVPAILKQGNAFYFPSYTESQPNSLIEAMLMGLPFVASNIDPVKEAMPMGFHEQLVDPDDVQSAQSKVEKIIEGKSVLDFKQLSNWAAKQYGAETRFEELKKVLLDR